MRHPWIKRRRNICIATWSGINLGFSSAPSPLASTLHASDYIAGLGVVALFLQAGTGYYGCL